MGRGRRIALNTAWLSMAQILGALAGVFVVGYVARALGPDGYGEVEGAISLVTHFTPIIFAGIQLILIREVCARPEIAARAVGDALVIRALLAPIFVGGVLSLYLAIDAEVSWAVLVLALINGFLLFYLQCFELAFEAFERMHFIALAVLICYVVGMSASVASVRLDLGPVGLMGARTLGVAAQTAVLAVSLRVVFFRPKIEWSPRRYLAILRQGLPLLVSVALNLELLELGRTVLLASFGAHEVGIYSSAASLSSKFLMFVHALTQAVQPGLCKTWNESKEAYADLLGRSMRFILIVTLPMAFGSFFVARDLIVFIFGEGYAGAGLVMAVLMSAVPLQFLSHVLNASVVARGREIFVAVGAALAVAADLIFGVLVIPRVGILGAGLTTLFSLMVLVGFFLAVQHDILLSLLRRLELPRVLLANGVLVGVCWALRGQNAALVIVAAAAVYAVAVFALRCIDREEIRAVTGR